MTPKKNAETLARHEFWRSFYLAQLAELPAETVADFWRGHGFTVDDKECFDAALVECLWTKNMKVPVRWHHAMTQEIEPFMVDRGLDAVEFHRKMLIMANSGTFVSTGTFLQWILPIIGLFIRVNDVREVFFPIGKLFIENLFPNHTFQRVKKVVEGKTTFSHMIYIDDLETFDNIPFNYDLIAIEQIRWLPLSFGLSPFEHIQLIADRRTIKDLLWEGDYEEYASEIIHDGELLAKKKSMSDFQLEHKLNLSKFKVPNWTVWKAERDYFCPRRKRVVIYKGACYSSPLYSILIKHEKTERPNQIPISKLLANAENEDRRTTPDIRRQHELVLQLLSPKEVYCYFEADESITLDGKTLIKGIPAKILKQLLLSYLNDGKSEFEYRELKRSFEITLGQKNSNFEIRFSRLIDKLTSENSKLVIQKTARGRFKLIPGAAIEFNEYATVTAK